MSVEAPSREESRSHLASNLLFSAVLLPAFLGLIWGVSLLLGLASVNIPAWFLEIDSAVYRAMVGINIPQLTGFIFLFFNDPGVDYTIAIAACLGYMWVRRRRKIGAAAVAIGLTLIVGAWTMPFMQAFGFRPRPFLMISDVVMNEEWRKIWAGIPTFPSGHIRELTGLSLVLALFWPAARWFALAYVVFIAFSRVYIGAHFPSDVIAGIVVGLMSGSFSFLAVERGRLVLAGLGSTPAVRTRYDYVFKSKTGEPAADPLLAKLVRSGLAFALLVAGAFALGYVVYIRDPRILADYLRNTDNSLVYPIFRRFDPGWAQIVYWMFADGVKTYAALAALTLGVGAFRGRQSVARVGLAIGVAFIVSLIVAGVVGGSFGRGRPFTTGEAPLPEMWQSQWLARVTFPDIYLLVAMALSWILARLCSRLRPVATAYPLLVAISLLYFGAIWPTDAVATLLVGYWVAEYSLFVSRQVFFWSRERSPVAPAA